MTSRIRRLVDGFRTAVQAGLMPYWDVDPDEVDANGSTGKFMNMEVVFKNGDKNVDLKMETSQGMNEFHDYPLSLEWTKRLRNLKMTSTIKRLIDMKIISKYFLLIQLPKPKQ